MIDRKEAEAIIYEAVRPTDKTTSLPLIASAGSVLADDIATDVATPPFNRATMDGYAVISSDGPGDMEVAEYIPAGFWPQVRLTPGKVSKVMTGAPAPAGADAVVPVERTGGYVEVGEKARIDAQAKPGENISPKGEDLLPGDTVLTKGTLIGPVEVAVLAGAGCAQVPVYARPKVAILSTGDELVAPDMTPGPGQIRNSNAYALSTQVALAGGEPVIIGVAPDDKEGLIAKVKEGATYDFLLVSGGVSAGDRDFGREALAEAGYDLLFTKVRIKPGKPTVFGVKEGNCFVFGLPGNPVSTFAIFELFVKPAIFKWRGIESFAPARLMATLQSDCRRRAGEREEYIPVTLTYVDGAYRAEPNRYHGSGHIHAVTLANALFMLPVGVTEAEAGYQGEAIFIR